jgi:hypothetical protein
MISDWTRASLEALRPLRMSEKPRWASSCARARPIPSLAPVIRAQGLDGPWRHRERDDARMKKSVDECTGAGEEVGKSNQACSGEKLARKRHLVLRISTKR